jgi:hypothetical protein
MIAFGFGLICKNWIDNPKTKSESDFGLITSSVPKYKVD